MTESTSNMTVEIINKILDMIGNGTLKPGNKLPPERMLAELLSVSRVCIREALKTLETMNVITIRPRLGAFVNDISAFDMLKNEELKKLFNNSAIFEVSLVRQLLEPAICEFITQTISEEEINALQKISNEMINLAKEPNISIDDFRARYVQLDIEFHTILYNASKNNVLLSMMSSIMNIMAESIKSAISVENFISRDFQGHHDLVDALRSRDPDLARNTMKKHIKKSHLFLHEVTKITTKR